MEKSDEFDECMFNRQNFSHQNFALTKFWYCILLCRKDAPEDKDPPEGNEACLSKVIPL